MTIDETLAQASDFLVYSSMVTLTVAMVTFSVALAKSRRLESIKETTARTTALSANVRMGSTLTLENPSVTTSVESGSGRRAGNIGMAIMWLTTILLGSALVARGISAQRLPWGNMYEFSLAGGFAVLVAYCVLSIKRDLRWLGVFVSIPVLLNLGLAVTVLYTESAPLVPALRSYWLAIHVSAAIICMGAFTVGAAISSLYLVAENAENRVAANQNPKRIDDLAKRLPSSDRLDLMSYRIHAFMFPLWTFSVIAGAIWAEAAWGRYWGWDPKETWAFITWIVYAAYLHARATAGWRGRKAAYIAIAGYLTILFNYFVVNIFVQGLHSYSGI
jgi:cytochrome c-type biogenesis protein CcsB